MRLRFLRRSIPPAGVCRVFRVLAALTFAGALLPATVRADIQNPGRSTFPGDRALAQRGERPANAVPQTTTVAEGGSVTIILRARGHASEMVDFLLRTPPAHGTFDGDPRQLTLNSASVTYTPRPGDDTTEDSFTFAVQTRGGPVSAEALVTIRIKEPPPALAVSPAELDFGAVKAGGSTRAELTLSNQGGGEAVGRVEPPPPWVVEGPAEYRLPRGASQTFALVFRPQIERVYTESLHFRQETGGGGVRLVGTGLAGPGQPPAVAGTAGSLAGQPAALPQQTPGEGNSPPPPSVADVSRPARDPGAPVPIASPGVTSLEPANRGDSIPSVPTAAAPYSEVDDAAGVTAFEVRSRGRSTLDLSWRVPTPLPKSYRVELRYLSLDSDDRLIVEWRPYAQVEFQTAHGFVNARLSGLPADTQECVRVVAVDATGVLATPSPMLVVYTLPPSTWWRPTALKVLIFLLVLCGGMALRHRWENAQILAEIDASRRRTARPAGSWG